MSLEIFLNNFMDNYKLIETSNIKKLYNNDFDVFVYKNKNKFNTIVIDKRNSQNIIYNNIEIAVNNIKNK